MSDSQSLPEVLQRDHVVLEQQALESELIKATEQTGI